MSEYILDLTAFDSETLDDGLREEIVRCRDCEYYDDGWCHEPGPDGIDKSWYVGKPGDGFCSWGERKEGDK